MYSFVCLLIVQMNRNNKWLVSFSKAFHNVCIQGVGKLSLRSLCIHEGGDLKGISNERAGSLSCDVIAGGSAASTAATHPWLPTARDRFDLLHCNLYLYNGCYTKYCTQWTRSVREVLSVDSLKSIHRIDACFNIHLSISQS